MTRLFILILLAGLLTGCVVPAPGPEAFTDAKDTLAAAERAGGDEHAPVEMRFAREKLAAAEDDLDRRANDLAWHHVEQSEINSELAIEKSRTAEIREQVSRQRQANAELRTQLEQNYGEDFE